MTLNRFNKLLLLAVIGLASSCSCNWHLDRIKKKCDSHFKTDTIHIRDTIFVKGAIADTVFKRSSDTVRLNYDRLHVKYYYNNHDSTTYIYGKCDPMVIYEDRVVTVEKNVFEFDYLKKYKWYFIIPILVLMLLVILRYIFKK